MDETKKKSEADLATEAACTMLVTGLKARAPRFANIKKNEDMYNGITTPALKGRNNVPFDCFVMGGFIDTLMSNVDEPVSLKYNRTREQDKMAADKMTAVWERETAADKGAWNDKMMDGKLLMALSGRMFTKLYVESLPKFKSDLTICDHYDMVTEAKGGGDLDKHLYKFQMNIFRSKSELKEGVAGGFYDQGQIRKVMAKYATQDFQKQNEDIMNAKNERWASFGINADLDSYVGTQLYRFVEGVIYYNGKWKYIVFSYETKTWIRYENLEDVFEHAKYYPGRGPWASAASHRHPFAFWTKAPADDIRPIGYTMKKVINLTLDNLEKRNWDMTAYDPKIFREPSQFLYKQDGIVRATLKNGQRISDGLYKFQTPDTTSITINLVEWLNNFMGRTTGITPDAQGAAQTDRVGILYSNLQQVSKRMMIYNKMLRKMYVDLGVMFDYGVYEHLREPYAVKLIGIEGVRWEEEVTRKDAECEFSITVVSGLEEDQKNAIIAEKRELGFTAIENNPNMMSRVNPSWYLRERFKSMGYNDEQIRVATDTVNDGNDLVLAKAAEAIQKCIDGVEYIALQRDATTGFIQKILDFAADKFPLIPPEELAKMTGSQKKKYRDRMKVHDKLIKYATDHLPIAQKNMERKLVSVIAAAGAAQPEIAPVQSQNPNMAVAQNPSITA